MHNQDDMTDLILADRIDGLSYDAIGKKHAIDPMDARSLAREALARTAEEDEWELRAISLLRLEKVVQKLWAGVNTGSFKHAEVLVKTLDQINTLLALNKQVMEEMKSAISDEQAEIIYAVVSENNRQIFRFLQDELKPNKKQLLVLDNWSSVAAEASTAAIEAVLVEEEDE